MSRGINKVILIGHVGGDPEVRYTQAGEAIANFTLATTEKWQDKSGQQQTRTEWHKIVFYKRMGEIVREYVRKGSKVYVEGMLKTNKWQDKNGADHYTTQIVGQDLQLLDNKKSNGEEQSTAQQLPLETVAAKNYMDDDIPF